MAQFTIYTSADTSAPTLSGTSGSLVDLLDKCLVTGYGAKTNAGWTKPYSGSNKAIFQQGAGSNGFCLRVQDDAPGAGGTKEARITGYEAMTHVDTGSFPFPTAAQGVGGIAMQVVRKSVNTTATAREWIVAADSRTVYVFISTGDTASTYNSFMFGEFYSLLPADGYRCMLIGRNAENGATTTYDRLDLYNNALLTTGGHFMARGYTGVTGSISLAKTMDNVKGGNTNFTNGTVAFPNPADGGVWLSPVWISDPTTPPINGLRGRMRGFWHFVHPVASLADRQILTGTGDFAGKTFLFIKFSANAAAYVIETSDTLETN